MLQRKKDHASEGSHVNWYIMHASYLGANQSPQYAEALCSICALNKVFNHLDTHGRWESLCGEGVEHVMPFRAEHDVQQLADMLRVYRVG